MVDKRHVRRDLADYFCTRGRGRRGLDVAGAAALGSGLFLDVAGVAAFAVDRRPGLVLSGLPLQGALARAAVVPRHFKRNSD